MLGEIGNCQGKCRRAKKSEQRDVANKDKFSGGVSLGVAMPVCN